MHRVVESCQRIESIRISWANRFQLLQRCRSVEIEGHLIFQNSKVQKDALILRLNPSGPNQVCQSGIYTPCRTFIQRQAFAHDRHSKLRFGIVWIVHQHTLIEISRLVKLAFILQSASVRIGWGRACDSGLPAQNKRQQH
jgi:hypothetical protein